jgi:hypothetical protein
MARALAYLRRKRVLINELQQNYGRGLESLLKSRQQILFVVARASGDDGNGRHRNDTQVKAASFEES